MNITQNQIRCRKCNLPDTKMYEQIDNKFEHITGKITLCSHCVKREKNLKMRLINQ
jgi:hypothetical protein